MARRPGGAVVRRVEDVDALYDPPLAGWICWLRQDHRQAEVPRRPVGRAVPRLAARLALESAEHRPRLTAVPALPDAGPLRAGDEPPVRRDEARDLRELQPGVAVPEPVPRLHP